MKTLKNRKNRPLALIFAFLIALSALFVPIGRENLPYVASADDTVFVSIASTTAGKVITPNSSLKAYFQIQIDKDLPDGATVKVYYRTRNESAIASVGTEKNDYVPVDNSITFIAGGSKSQMLSVTTYKQTAIAVNYTGSARNDISGTRTFEVEIYKVETEECTAEIDGSKKSVRVELLATEYYDATTVADSPSKTSSFCSSSATVKDPYGNNLTFDKQLFYTDYVNYSELTNFSQLIELRVTVEDTKWAYPFQSVSGYASKIYALENSFINRGLAHAYAGITNYRCKDNTICIQCYENSYINVYTMKPGDSDYVSAQYMKLNSSCNFWQGYGAWDISDAFLNKNKHGYLVSVTSSTSSYVDKTSYLRYDSNSILYRLNQIETAVSVENCCDWDTRRYELQYYQVVVDDIMPYPVKYVYDDVKLDGDGKARIAVRFNENVQVSASSSAKKPVLKVETTTSPARTMDFEYAGGSGTDTLWFEYDLSKFNYSESVVALKVRSLEGDICDLSMNRCACNGGYTWGFGSNFVDCAGLNIPDNTRFTFKYDFRTPNVSVPDTMITELQKPSQQKSISISLSQANEATVKYAWSDKDVTADAFVDYDSTTEFVNGTSVVSGNSHAIQSPLGLTGEYYLYLQVTSPLKRSVKKKFGPFSFDNTPPEIKNFNDETGSMLTQKNFTFTLEDTYSPIYNVSAVYYSGKLLKHGDDRFTDEIPIVKEGESVFAGLTFTKKDISADLRFSLKAADVGIGENEYGYFHIAIKYSDKLGNVFITTEKEYRFDTRILFYSKEVITSGDLILTTQSEEKVFNVSAGNVVITPELDGNSVTEDAGGTWGIDAIRYNDEDVTYETPIQFNSASHTLTVPMNVPLGRYEIVYSLEKGGTKKVSDAYYYYFVKGEEETENYKNLQGNLVLVNQVYQLKSDYYNLVKGSGNIVNMTVSSYNGTSQRATFSSAEEAYKYVYYMECRDMYIEVLTQNTAQILNTSGGDVNYSKADDTVAQEGQLWIRYKRSSWTTPLRRDDLSGWCYYYYAPKGFAQQINPMLFNNTLKTAVETVSEKIVLKGSAEWLYKVPYLTEEQMHVNAESVTETYSGTPFAYEWSYAGDSALYSNTVRADDKEVPLVTNYRFALTDSTRIFIAAKTESLTPSDYVEYIPDGASTFGTILSQDGNPLTTGLYSVCELDGNGMSYCDVYIDKTVPMLDVTYSVKQKDGSISSVNIPFGVENDGGTYSARSFTIGAIDASEFDTYSYVSVTDNYSGIVNNYDMASLRQDVVLLEDGYYTLKVSDRSGNGYSFTAKVSQKEMVCNASTADNRITVTVSNRTSAQIYRYLIKCDGITVADSYVQSYTSEESGFYDIYIEDIFGNVYQEVIEFRRTLPEIKWYYRVDGSYDSYNEYFEDCYAMQIVYLGGTTYLVNTSKDVRFSYTGPYAYEVINGTDDYVYDSFHGVSYVKLKPDGNMSVRIYYKNDPEISVTYNCFYDNVAPVIHVSYMANEYQQKDLDLPEEFYLSLKDGDVIVPETIAFTSKGLGQSDVFNGSQVYSMLFSVSANDETGVDSIEVYLNGTLVDTYTGVDGYIEDFSLCQRGKYELVAKDIFGNISVFTFENRFDSPVRYFVDEKEYEVNFNVVDNFYSDGGFSDEKYGHSTQRLEIANGNYVFYIIETETDKYFHCFDIEDGKVIAKAYVFKEESSDEGTVAQHVKLIDDPGYLESVLYDGALEKGEPIAIIGTNDYLIYASANEDGVISLTIEALTKEFLTVSARVNDQEMTEPFFGKSVISTALPSLNILYGDDLTPATVVETGDNSGLVKVKDNFTVTFDYMSISGVNEIYFAYAKTEEIPEYYKIFGTDADFESFYISMLGSLCDDWDTKGFNEKIYDLTSGNGYYFIRITNVFGNYYEYTVVRADVFMIFATASYDDGSEVFYDFDYEGEIFANRTVSYRLYYPETTFVKSSTLGYNLKRGTEVISEGTVADGHVISIEKEGDYTLTVFDEFGNTAVRKAHIKLQAITPNDKVLTGFNKKAMKEGYTNGFVSIDKDICQQENYAYVSVRFGEKLTILYDELSQNKVAWDETAFNNAVGIDGSGEYVITFRDSFGNGYAKSVHIRFENPLKLQRMTKSNLLATDYPLDIAEELGFWSNHTLLFSTEASVFEFTVDGEAQAISLPIKFDSTTEVGTFYYDIYYHDEYGFETSFKAYLYRQTPMLKLDESVSYEVFSGVKNTRDNITYYYGDDATCVYYKDGSIESVPYASGTVIKADGSYRFEVVDFAGNITSDTIRRDTVCNFEFKETAVSKAVISGGVVTTSRVTFSSIGGDEVRVVNAVLNGEDYDNFNGNDITDNGKWEFLLKDKIGNVSYFSFYLISHECNGFTYTTPYGYTITDAWYYGGTGLKVPYMQFIAQGDGTSSFDFNENGVYELTMTSSYTKEARVFSFTINTAEPEVELVGCEDGDTTVNTVTFDNLAVGDIIKIYKNGKLVSTTVYAPATTIPKIAEGGDYKVVVTSRAGVSKSFTFKRTHIANAAGSIVIIITIFATVIGLLIGLLYHTKLKTDE